MTWQTCVCRCAGVCSQWYALAWQPFLWTVIDVKDTRLDVDYALKTLTRRLGRHTPGICALVETIRLNGCTRLTDSGLRMIAKRCPELRRLEINGCHLVTNAALFDVFSKCTNLLYLSASGKQKTSLTFMQTQDSLICKFIDKSSRPKLHTIANNNGNQHKAWMYIKLNSAVYHKRL